MVQTTADCLHHSWFWMSCQMMLVLTSGKEILLINRNQAKGHIFSSPSMSCHPHSQGRTSLLLNYPWATPASYNHPYNCMKNKAWVKILMWNCNQTTIKSVWQHQSYMIKSNVCPDSERETPANAWLHSLPFFGHFLFLDVLEKESSFLSPTLIYTNYHEYRWYLHPNTIHISPRHWVSRESWQKHSMEWRGKFPFLKVRVVDLHV